MRCELPAPAAPAIADGGPWPAQPVVLAEAQRDVGSAHGVELLRLIDECLERAGANLAAIDAIGVTLGPGSFTGLRVALATAKGLALAGDIPLLGISTLEAFAAAACSGRREAVLWPCLDARKREVYAAPFRALAAGASVSGVERLDEDRALLPTDLAPRLFAFDAPSSSASPADAPLDVVLLGEGAARYGDIFRAAVANGGGRASLELLPWPEIAPSGAMIACLACTRLAGGERDDLAGLVPRYARRAEAEVMLEARRRSETPVRPG